jgi:hypothetical protein
MPRNPLLARSAGECNVSAVIPKLHWYAFETGTTRQTTWGQQAQTPEDLLNRREADSGSGRLFGELNAVPHPEFDPGRGQGDPAFNDEPMA